jgi:two-component system secretion response regulator SsrB
MSTMNNVYRINLPNMRPYCRIFIADQHKLMIFAFRRLLINHPHLKVVGSSGSGLEAMKLCRRQAPTLVIVDPYLSEMNGLDFIRLLKRRFDNIKIIAYFSRRDDDKLSHFVDAGVDGIVDKSSSIDTLLKAIHCVNEGGNYFDNIRINDKEWKLELTEIAESGYSLLPKISARERQILKLIAEGQRNKGIASLLSISVKTVESHRFNLMKKLDAHSIADLVSWARKYNVL